MILVRPEPLDGATALALIGALNQELAATYPEEGATHFRLDLDEVAPGRGAFVVAWDGAHPLGCGAVRCLDEVSAELKRMYVVPEGRGRGVGRALLEALEGATRALGRRRLVLETGTRQLAALGLYERAGYRPIAPYGEYLDSPLSVCLARDL